MNMELIRNAVAEAAKRFGAEEYELTISDKENTAVEALNKEVSSISYSRTGTMTVRCWGTVGWGASSSTGSRVSSGMVSSNLNSSFMVVPP